MEVKNKELTITSNKNPRRAWDAAFKKAGSKKESAMVSGDGMALSSWDQSEWEW